MPSRPALLDAGAPLLYLSAMEKTCAERLLTTLLLRIAAELDLPPEHETRLAHADWGARYLNLDERTKQRILNPGQGRSALMQYWEGEWATVLAWALGLTDELPRAEEAGPFEKLWELPLPPRDPTELLASAHFRADTDSLVQSLEPLITDAQDWLAKHPKIPADRSTATARSRALERGRAAEWLVRLLKSEKN